MYTQTTKIIWLIVSAVMIVLISVLATLSIQKFQHNKIIVPNPVPPQPLMAQVIAVNPHYINISKPIKNCSPSRQVIYSQPQQQGISSSAAAAVVGGVAGGLLGSTVKGNNRSLAIGAGAAVGALTGKAVGEKIHQSQPQPEVQEKIHCSTHYVSTPVQKGYQVTYLLNGQQGMIIMDQPPQTPMLSLPMQGEVQQPSSNNLSSSQATQINVANPQLSPQK